MIRTACHVFRVKRSDVVGLNASGIYVSIHMKSGLMNISCGENETPEGVLNYLFNVFFNGVEPYRNRHAVESHGIVRADFSPASWLETKTSDASQS